MKKNSSTLAPIVHRSIVSFNAQTHINARPIRLPLGYIKSMIFYLQQHRWVNPWLVNL